MIEVTKKDLCCGCSACVPACPKGIISLVSNKAKFYTSHIQASACIDCEACVFACPTYIDIAPTPKHHAIERFDKENYRIKAAYALIAKDEDLRAKSTSGGAFSLLAKAFFENLDSCHCEGAERPKQSKNQKVENKKIASATPRNDENLDSQNPRAVVYGAQFDKNMKVLHGRATNIGEIAKFRGSKYVQSDMGDTFERIKKELRAGVRVLFSGAPCQCAGLRMYLGKEYENLFVIDFICHGVPGPGLWEQYVKYKQKVYGSKMKYAHFRNKSAGWYNYTMKLDFENGKSSVADLRTDEYLCIFLRDTALMESCYNCPAKGYTRYSDITIADFWGIEGVRADFFDDLGTSLVCVNSQKGARWLESINSACRLAEVPVSQALARNPSMLKSVPRPKKRDEFEKDFARLERLEVSFEWIYKKYGRDVPKVRIKRFVHFGLGALARLVLGKAGAKRLKGILKRARSAVKGGVKNAFGLA